MPKRMLIDASHPEETRVVVLDGQKVEEFDFESASRRPLKGNIYLAKVTRVEPSLQAAFVEYGGNRQGFLAFSEIHPDYYQIPMADRQALLEQQQAEVRRRAEEEFEPVETGTAVVSDEQLEASDEADAAEQSGSEDDATSGEETSDAPDADGEEVFDNKAGREDEPDDSEDTEEPDGQPDSDRIENGEHLAGDDASHEFGQDAAGSDDEAGAFEMAADAAIEGAPVAGESSSPEGDEPAADGQPAQALHAARPSQRFLRRRHYKIQEVIKRRQIILVQVVKEERGNKGAALTTYLSLAGRYCVLMPNTPRGGGISRKITNAGDRKRLKAAAAALELPEGMGLIIRTAGENRTKVEIKRDYEYLLRMWDTIRERTLRSNAPTCVNEEGDLIKRAIRDLYNKDVAEVVVEGDDGYRNAKDFMRMLMPSHAKNVKLYKEPVPLFQRHHIEAQLDAMFQPTVTLRSGGYIVINQTEALVSIDVNSGRATREHSIEETAHKTNLEAADEIARQLRLRDLAGLIVIDFIDMEDSRNDRSVERRLRDATKNDRARIQIGKISQFGLLEMSRQRLRAGVIAGSTVPCPHCGGQGIVRSVESTALRVLRALDDEGQKQKAAAVTVRVPSDVAIYTLNQKRRELARIENDYGMTVSFLPKDDVLAGNFEIERTAQRAPEDRKYFPTEAPPAPEETLAEAPGDMEEEVEEEEEHEDLTHAEPPAAAPLHGHGQRAEGSYGEDGGRRRRRRRRRGRDRDRGPASGQRAPQQPEQHLRPDPFDADRFGYNDDIPDTTPLDGASQPSTDIRPADGPVHLVPASGEAAEAFQNDGGHRRRRRRRRGRRRDGERYGMNAESQLEGVPVDPSVRDEGEEIVGTADDGVEADAAVARDEAPRVVPNAPSAPVWSLTPETPKREIADVPRASKPIAVEEPEPAGRAAPEPRIEAPPARTEPAATEPPQPPRKGWWQRTFRS
ncbi:MAG TPA: Rne/Rng family ribonuclease [Rhizomicrobium sp.]|nr:Rne/Rng family ribonuclease [Rhizomicrobium sp.]